MNQEQTLNFFHFILIRKLYVLPRIRSADASKWDSKGWADRHGAVANSTEYTCFTYTKVSFTFSQMSVGPGCTVAMVGVGYGWVVSSGTCR